MTRVSKIRRVGLALVCACVMSGCHEVANYAPEAPASEPTAADETTAAQPTQPPLNPVDDVAQQDLTPPLDDPPDAAAQTPPPEAPPGAPPADSNASQPLTDLDDLFGTPPDEESPEEEPSPPAGEADRVADAGTDPFVDDPLHAGGDEDPLPLWRTDEADSANDGFDELFSEVASDAPDAGQAPAPSDTSPEPPPQEPDDAAEPELPPLPEWSPEPPDEPAIEEEPADADSANDRPSTETSSLQWRNGTPLESEREPTEPPPPAETRGATAPLAVDATNTRLLAWLLGARFSLAVVAGSDGAADDWAPAALAEMLGIEPPDRPAARGEQERITLLIKNARSLGEQLAARHGRDHAALLEIALKTNALAAVYESRPELAAPVARAVEKAAPHTGLHPALWTEFLELLKGDPTPDQVRRSVFSLHAAVQRALRQSP